MLFHVTSPAAYWLPPLASSFQTITTAIQRAKPITGPRWIVATTVSVLALVLVGCGGAQGTAAPQPTQLAATTETPTPIKATSPPSSTPTPSKVKATETPVQVQAPTHTAPPPSTRPPRGRGDTEAASARLGISIEALRRALGPPPADIPAAARKLGISEDDLRQALFSTSDSPPPTASPVPSSAARPTPEPVPAATPTPEPVPAESKVVTERYLMAFHACDESTVDCNNPSNHQAYVAQSDDGASWSILAGWEAYPGSVPDVIRRGNTLYIYAGPNLTRYDLSTDTLEPHKTGPNPFDPAKQVRIQGLSHEVYDYSATIDGQDRLVLFFHYLVPEAPAGEQPGYCPPDEAPCAQHFISATEVAGSDGKVFTLDEGDRLVVTVGNGGQEQSASDQDVFFNGEEWVMYISQGQSTSAWTSPELRGSYSKVGVISDNQGGVPAGHYDSKTGQYWTYTFMKIGGMGVIRRAAHSRLSQPVPAGEWSEVITPQITGLSLSHNFESPGFAVNE